MERYTPRVAIGGTVLNVFAPLPPTPRAVRQRSWPGWSDHQNLADRATVENVVGKISNHLRRIDWPNQRRRRVNGIDAVKAGAEKAVATSIELARADVQGGVVGWRERQRANCQRLRAVKDRRPRCAAVKRTPHTALRSAQIDLAGFVGSTTTVVTRPLTAIVPPPFGSGDGPNGVHAASVVIGGVRLPLIIDSIRRPFSCRSIWEIARPRAIGSKGTVRFHTALQRDELIARAGKLPYRSSRGISRAGRGRPVLLCRTLLVHVALRCARFTLLTLRRLQSRLRCAPATSVAAGQRAEAAQHEKNEERNHQNNQKSLGFHLKNPFSIAGTRFRGRV